MAGKMGKGPAGTGQRLVGCLLPRPLLLAQKVPSGPAGAEQLRAQWVGRWRHQVGWGRQAGDHMLAAGFTVGEGMDGGSQVGNAHWYCPVRQLLGQNLNHPSRTGAERQRDGDRSVRGQDGGAKGGQPGGSGGVQGQYLEKQQSTSRRWQWRRCRSRLRTAGKTSITAAKLHPTTMAAWGCQGGRGG